MRPSSLNIYEGQLDPDLRHSFQMDWNQILRVNMDFIITHIDTLLREYFKMREDVITLGAPPTSIKRHASAR